MQLTRWPQQRWTSHQKAKVFALIEQAQETPALFEEKMEDTHDIMKRRELTLPEPKSEALSGLLG